MLSATAVARVERRVNAALASGDLSGLDVLGFGEVSTVLCAYGAFGKLACKRLLPFRDEASANEAATVILGYIAALRARGIDVIDTQVTVIQNAEGAFVVYCTQPALPAHTLGPAYLRQQSRADAKAACRRLFTHIKAAVSETLAPDGQLSNWAFVGDALSAYGEPKEARLLYLDVTSPFWRDDEGVDHFDFTHLLRTLPPVARLPARYLALKPTLDSYFSLRGQALDFLGNLQKENLGHLKAELLPMTNAIFALDPPICEHSVARYYARDARRYARLQAAARFRCWFQHRVKRQPYPFLPKPRIRRYS